MSDLLPGVAYFPAFELLTDDLRDYRFYAADMLHPSEVAEDYIFSRFPKEQIWWVGGYALGIALPPDWVGHTYLSNDAYEQFTWEPGYVTNYENILFDRSAGWTASYMETLLMTDTGIEVLSTVPRTLRVIGN